MFFPLTAILVVDFRPRVAANIFSTVGTLVVLLFLYIFLFGTRVRPVPMSLPIISFRLPEFAFARSKFNQEDNGAL